MIIYQSALIPIKIPCPKKLLVTRLINISTDQNGWYDCDEAVNMQILNMLIQDNLPKKWYNISKSITQGMNLGNKTSV